MYHVNQNGGTVMKALFFEYFFPNPSYILKKYLFRFPEDFNTYEIDEQFLLGHILVSPVLQPVKIIK